MGSTPNFNMKGQSKKQIIEVVFNFKNSYNIFKIAISGGTDENDDSKASKEQYR
jgi:hypothetical protein